MLDDSWRESLQSQGVVDSNGYPARCSWVITDYASYLSLKRKMATFVLCDFHPVHPLQNTNVICHISLLIFFNIRTVIVTHHYGIIVSTSHSKNDSGSVFINPACRHQHLSFIPHPANEISQSGVLCDVIVAGRNWHVNHWASLGKIQLP